MAGGCESLRTSCWFELGFVTDGQAMIEVMESGEQEDLTPTLDLGMLQKEVRLGSQTLVTDVMEEVIYKGRWDMEGLFSGLPLSTQQDSPAPPSLSIPPAGPGARFRHFHPLLW